jgi:hypothetical protein
MRSAITPIESSYHVSASDNFLLAIAKGSDHKPRCFRSVRVDMMNIWKMRVRMCEWNVAVRMGMRFLAVPFEIMLMLVMFIVTVPMIVLQRAMRMRMVMALADMQPDAERHQGRSEPEQEWRHFGPEDQREGDAEQRRH